jgi:hypothetical protein
VAILIRPGPFGMSVPVALFSPWDYRTGLPEIMPLMPAWGYSIPLGHWERGLGFSQALLTPCICSANRARCGRQNPNGSGTQVAARKVLIDVPLKPAPLHVEDTRDAAPQRILREILIGV